MEIDMGTLVKRYVAYLTKHKIRVSCKAAAQTVGLLLRSIGSMLVRLCPLASWVAKAAIGSPLIAQSQRWTAILISTAKSSRPQTT
jgi:hypothetical protein